MRIAFGCDHRGYILKQGIIAHLQALGHEVIDCGTSSVERTDYPIYGERVGRMVAGGQCDIGVLVCGTGYGISLAAGRVTGIRAVCCSDPYTARLTRSHNNANVISLGSMVVGEGLALQILDAFFAATFEGGRHAQRLEMIDAIR